jgi:predicted Ser/Thr protein kinase
LIGETLGKYRITEHLGGGGMAEVYKAYQPGLDRYVAIKVLHSFLAGEEDFLTRFQREARVIAMLRHPNIVQVHDFDYDEEDNAYYIVMEFIDGPSLKEHVQEVCQEEQILPLDETVHIVTGIANALEYAHQRGAVHRDVKPANILFTEDGEAILTDFGIAKMVNIGGLTASGAMIGTPAYMAPEQGLGQAGDERADIYSLGAVFYQLVTGCLPFDADTTMGVVLKHINDPPPPPTSINPDLPEGIEAVILRALAKDPEDRYQTAKEFIADLRRAMAGQPVEAVSPGLPMMSAATVGARAPDHGKRAEATVVSAPAYTPPYTTPPPITPPPQEAPAIGWQRRWTVWLLAALTLVLVGGCAALVATGRAELLLAAFANVMSQLMTPTPSPDGTPTPNIVSTEVAAALATQNARATYEATVNATATPTPLLTATPTPDLTATSVAGCVFNLEIVYDPAVQPSLLAPGQRFVKRWRIKNTGTCAWPEGADLVFVSGDELTVIGKPVIAPLAPDETLEIELSLQAPTRHDTYTSVWQLQDGEGNPIGEQLEITCRVAPTPTPKTTATPTPTPTPKVAPTSTEPLWMSVPGLTQCSGAKGQIAWGRGGGPSNEYRYFYSRVAPEFELAGPYNDFEGFPHVMTYYTTSGELAWPIPDNCCPGDYGRYVSPEGYEIVWRKAYQEQSSCPSQ